MTQNISSDEQRGVEEFIRRFQDKSATTMREYQLLADDNGLALIIFQQAT